MQTPSTPARVAVLGAGGHTGKFVVKALRQKGATPIAATRSGRFTSIAESEQTCRAIDFANPASLDGALAGADAVINCAGPFFDTAAPAAQAALRASIPYLDVTAEQMTTLRLFENLQAKATEIGVPLVPAMAFFGGLADLLVSSLVQDQPKIDSIDVAVGLNSWHPTQGTRLTGERNKYPRMIVRHNSLVPVPTPPPSRSWTFPPPLGEQPVTCVALAEIILISRHIRADAITSFMNLKPLEDLSNPATPAPQARDASGRSAQQFIMDVRIATGGQIRRATATGRDIYAVTAPLVVNACLALLAGEKPLGVRTPGELFAPRPFLAGLAPDIDVRFATCEAQHLAAAHH